MYVYEVSSQNQEGFDFFFTLMHEKMYSQCEFVDLIENIIADCYEEVFKSRGYASLDYSKFSEKLSNSGFIFHNDLLQASYGFDPGNSDRTIRSKRLVDAINRKYARKK